ncbi:MAG: hypothetical protein WAT68_05540 [Candidatus Nitrotoga sp.]
MDNDEPINVSALNQYTYCPRRRSLIYLESELNRAAIMTKIHFVVEDVSGRGFIARALGKYIFTETDNLKNLRQQVRDAVHCHFDEGKAPSFIGSHFSPESAV